MLSGICRWNKYCCLTLTYVSSQWFASSQLLRFTNFIAWRIPMLMSGNWLCRLWHSWSSSLNLAFMTLFRVLSSFLCWSIQTFSLGPGLGYISKFIQDIHLSSHAQLFSSDSWGLKILRAAAEVGQAVMHEVAEHENCWIPAGLEVVACFAPLHWIHPFSIWLLNLYTKSVKQENFVQWPLWKIS